MKNKIYSENSNKYILKKEHYFKLSKNATYDKNRLKVIAVIQYFDENNEKKINFFKINQLNEIMNPPKDLNYKIIKFLFPNTMYFYKGNILELTSIKTKKENAEGSNTCLLYTSDAADDNRLV